MRKTLIEGFEKAAKDWASGFFHDDDRNQETSLISIAVSLRRIADALEGKEPDPPVQ